MKCSELRRVTKCLEWTDALTVIGSVTSRSLSTSECYGLNGEKASDWLRLYAPNWAMSDFEGGVRLTSSDGQDTLSLTVSYSVKLEGSEAQLTEKQAVLSMHNTLPQGVKSVRALLQKKQAITISTLRSYKNRLR